MGYEKTTLHDPSLAHTRTMASRVFAHVGVLLITLPLRLCIFLPLWYRAGRHRAAEPVMRRALVFDTHRGPGELRRDPKSRLEGRDALVTRRRLNRRYP